MAVFVVDKKTRPSMARSGKRTQRQLLGIPRRHSRLVERGDGYAYSPAAAYRGKESEDLCGAGRRAAAVSRARPR